MRSAKKHRVSIVLVSLLGLEALASASTAAGRIQTLRVAVGISSTDRVSVQMGNATACPTQGWYAFESADNGVGRTWMEALLAAINANHTVIVEGTGTCDSAGLEMIRFIDFKPQ